MVNHEQEEVELGSAYIRHLADLVNKLHQRAFLLIEPAPGDFIVNCLGEQLNPSAASMESTKSIEESLVPALEMSLQIVVAISSSLNVWGVLLVAVLLGGWTDWNAAAKTGGVAEVSKESHHIEG